MVSKLHSANRDLNVSLGQLFFVELVPILDVGFLTCPYVQVRHGVMNPRTAH